VKRPASEDARRPIIDGLRAELKLLSGSGNPPTIGSALRSKRLALLFVLA
jgi:hypothetical protein